jgi:hypothetical protein
LLVARPEAFYQWHRRSEVQAVHPADHEVRHLETLFAQVVGAMLPLLTVVPSVELGGQTGLGIEQIRSAEEAFFEIKDRLVDQWLR